MKRIFIVMTAALVIAGCDDFQEGFEEGYEEQTVIDELDTSYEAFVDVTRCMEAEYRLARLYNSIAEVEDDAAAKIELTAYASNAEAEGDAFKELFKQMQSARTVTDEQIKVLAADVGGELDALEESGELEDLAMGIARITDKCADDYVTAETE